jgi:antitoxin component of MazEF toxin-antitoxin module
MRQRVREVGNSYVVTIPKKEVQRLGLKPGDLVDVALTPLETRPTLSPELRAIFEESWAEDEEAYGYLAGE